MSVPSRVLYRLSQSAQLCHAGHLLQSIDLLRVPVQPRPVPYRPFPAHPSIQPFLQTKDNLLYSGPWCLLVCMNSMAMFVIPPQIGRAANRDPAVHHRPDINGQHKRSAPRIRPPAPIPGLSADEQAGGGEAGMPAGVFTPHPHTLDTTDPPHPGRCTNFRGTRLLRQRSRSSGGSEYSGVGNPGCGQNRAICVQVGKSTNPDHCRILGSDLQE